MAISPTSQLLDSLPEVEKYAFLLKLLVDSDFGSELSPSQKNSWYGLLYDCSDLLDQHLGDMRRFADLIG